MAIRCAAVIDFQAVSRTYGEGAQRVIALPTLDLTIQPGECVALLGRSGCGKSTAMHLMGLLDLPSAGRYLLAGQDVTAWDADTRALKRNQMVGFVFQHFFLLPRLSVLANICLPLAYREANEADMQRAQDLLQQLGIAELAERYPSTLSGGQQQRVAIARALVGQPQVILADEPTGALDLETGQQVIDCLLSLNQQHGVTVVVVTHDQKIAEQCQRVVQLS